MRKGKVKKRILLPDPVYGDQLITRFVNNMTLDGKKSIAYRIFYTHQKEGPIVRDHLK